MNWQGEKISFLLIVLSFFLFFHTSIPDYGCAFERTTRTTEIELNYGTPVLLRFIAPITSSNAKVGQTVDLEVDEPVFSNGTMVIAEGTPAKGQIISCKAKTYAGEGGDLVIGNFYLLLENYQRIKLDGIYRIEGTDKRESLALGQVCLFGYLMKGEEALVREGQTFRTAVAWDVIINK
jgi:hypothetical protein